MNDMISLYRWILYADTFWTQKELIHVKEKQQFLIKDFRTLYRKRIGKIKHTNTNCVQRKDIHNNTYCDKDALGLLNTKKVAQKCLYSTGQLNLNLLKVSEAGSSPLSQDEF